MKYLFGILLLVSSLNVANAACSTYTSVPTGVNTLALKNVVVEGYQMYGLHTINIYAESLDYIGVTYNCVAVSYFKTVPSASDDYLRDEAIKLFKLGMALGYKLEFTTTYESSGVVRISSLIAGVSKP